jgi:ribosomal protein L17
MNDVVPLKRKRGRPPGSKTKTPDGRPPYKPTPETRDAVELLKAVGTTDAAIAASIGISTETLTKHFGVELTFGRVRKQREVLSMLFASAKKGNVAAQRHLEARMGVAGAQASFDEDADEKPVAREVRLGKKEQQAVEAAKAGVGTEWGEDLGRPN